MRIPVLIPPTNNEIDVLEDYAYPIRVATK